MSDSERDALTEALDDADGPGNRGVTAMTADELMDYLRN